MNFFSLFAFKYFEINQNTFIEYCHCFLEILEDRLMTLFEP